MQQEPEALSLEHALGVLRRRLPLVIFFVVVVAAAAFGFSRHETKQYTATASLDFNANPLSQQIAGLPTTSSGTQLAQQASNVELVKLGNMAAKTAALLGQGLTDEEVAESLGISGQGESSVVDVSATASTPTLAAEIANTYTNQFVREQQRANRQYFRSIETLVQRQLSALSPAQRIGGDGVELQNRAQTLALLSELNYGNVQIAQKARPPTSPSAPKTSRNTVVGMFLGLIIGLGVAFVLERLDRSIKAPEDLEAIYHLPMLGIVPQSTALARSTRGKKGKRSVISSSEAEVFSLIRAHLRFFNIDRDLRTILIASPAPGDGKTTVARYLAEAATKLGSRVLLLEVDLRDPTVAHQLDIRTGPGLAEVLIGAVQMNEATQSVQLEAAPNEEGGVRTLDVLVAGSVMPPNPAELIGSRPMDGVLAQARAMYDLVVIDTPPLTAVSDAFPLLAKVDGVVIVGRIGRRRDAAERLRLVLLNSSAPLLGVIANGSKSSSTDTYATARGDQPSHTAPSTNGATLSESIPTNRA